MTGKNSLFGGFLSLFSAREKSDTVASAADIPSIVAKLAQGRGEPCFAVLIFAPTKESASNTVSLQFSRENGVVGLDWVLLGPRNIADKQLIADYALRHECPFAEHELNNVQYLRAKGNLVADLGMKIICDFYKIPESAGLELITEGFTWQRT